MRLAGLAEDAGKVMSAPQIPTQILTIKRFYAFCQPVHLFKVADGTPFDFSAGTLAAQVRNVPDYQAAPLVQFTITAPIPTSGDLVLGLCAADAGLLPINTNTSFKVTTPLFGEISFVPAADPENPIVLVELDVRVAPGGNHSPAQAAAPTVPLETINIGVGGASPATTRALLGLTPAQIAYNAFLWG